MTPAAAGGEVTVGVSGVGYLTNPVALVHTTRAGPAGDRQAGHHPGSEVGLSPARPPIGSHPMIAHTSSLTIPARLPHTRPAPMVVTT
jgi:hypothetical protein